MGRAITAAVFIVALCVGLVTAFVFATKVHAKDSGQWDSIPQHVRDWFKSVRGKNGVACCDISDGHRTEFAIKDTVYWVPIDGVWIKVPPDAVIENSGNPTGDAVVWYAKASNELFIRCFVPGSVS